MERQLISVTEHLSNLIRIPSVSAISNRSIVAYASTVLTRQGWTVHEHTYVDDSGVEKVNLIAAPPGQDVTQRGANLAFLCHTDTVPYAPDWKDALRPILQENMLHGCGACDVKGFLACLLAAVESRHSQWADGLRIVLTADEEIGCIGSKRLVNSDVLRPQLLIIGEPTSLHPARAGKGYCLAHVTILGREAHSSLPSHGISSIYAAARFISSVEQFAETLTLEENIFFGPPFTTVNIGTVHGGSAKNIIPGRTELLVEWRPIPDQSPELVPAKLGSLLAAVEKQYPGLRTVLDVLRQDAGFETNAETSLVRSLENATGRSTVSIPFGSEAGIWSNVANEVVVFGPGEMSSAHSNREHVSLAELELCVQTVTQLMQSD